MATRTTARSLQRGAAEGPRAADAPITLGRCRDCQEVVAGIRDGQSCPECRELERIEDEALEPGGYLDFTPTVRVREAPGCPGILVAHLAAAPKPFVYVGRPMKGMAGSPLGNPFRSETTDDAIGAFRRHLNAAIQAVRGGQGTHVQRGIVAELLRIYAIYRERGRLTLACWCSPDPCHADVIAAAIVWLCQQEPVPVAGGLLARWEKASAAEGLPWVTRDAQGRVVRISATPAQAQTPRARDLFPHARTAPTPGRDGGFPAKVRS